MKYAKFSITQPYTASPPSLQNDLLVTKVPTYEEKAEKGWKIAILTYFMILHLKT